VKFARARPDKLDRAILAGLAFGLNQEKIAEVLELSHANVVQRLTHLKRVFDCPNSAMLLFKFIGTPNVPLEGPGYFPAWVWPRFLWVKRCLHQTPLSRDDAVLLAHLCLTFPDNLRAWRSDKFPGKDSICAKAGTDGPLLLIVSAAIELSQLRQEHFDRAAQKPKKR
jgi:hypothetical protein